MQGPTVEVEFLDPIVIPTLSVIGNPVEAWHCANCGSLVVDRERHADWHYGIAAGRPFGVTPPGFGPR